MVTEILPAVLGPLLTALIMVWLGRATAGAPLPSSTGVVRLRVITPVTVIGAVCLAIGAFFVIALFIPGMPVWFRLLISLPMVGLFGVLGAIIFLSGLRHEVFFSQQSVLVRDLRGRDRSFIWNEIATGKYHKLSNNLILVLKNGDRVKISQHLRGIDGFLLLLEQHTELPVSRWRVEMGTW